MKNKMILFTTLVFTGLLFAYSPFVFAQNEGTGAVATGCPELEDLKPETGGTGHHKTDVAIAKDRAMSACTTRHTAAIQQEAGEVLGHRITCEATLIQNPDGSNRFCDFGDFSGPDEEACEPWYCIDQDGGDVGDQYCRYIYNPETGEMEHSECSHWSQADVDSNKPELRSGVTCHAYSWYNYYDYTCN